MLIKALRVIGWISTCAGIVIAIVCVAMMLDRSPADFEGMIIGAGITVIVVVALPVFIVGLLIVAFTGRKLRNSAT